MTMKQKQKQKHTLGWLDQLLFGRVLRTQVDAMNIAWVCQNMARYQQINRRHDSMRRTCALLEKRG